MSVSGRVTLTILGIPRSPSAVLPRHLFTSSLKSPNLAAAPWSKLSSWGTGRTYLPLFKNLQGKKNVPGGWEGDFWTINSMFGYIVSIIIDLDLITVDIYINNQSWWFEMILAAVCQQFSQSMFKRKHTAPATETQSHETHTKALLGKGECCIAKKKNLPSPN